MVALILWSMMMDKDRKKREAPISYRPPASLRDEFQARVEKSGLSTSAFITKSIFNQAAPRASRRPPIEKKLLAKLLAEAGAIRQSLHDLSGANRSDPENAHLIAQALETLIDIRTAIMKVSGRKP